MNILVVTDNALVDEQVTAALGGDPGTQITTVATPQRAVALLDEDTAAFDVVVGDNDTHPTGGLFLAREIKARVQMGEAMPPVILLLARAQDRWLANWAQADAHVTKPIDPFDLAEVVDALVQGEPVPALPGVHSDPTPSPLDLPSGEVEDSGLHGTGGLTGGGP